MTSGSGGRIPIPPLPPSRFASTPTYRRASYASVAASGGSVGATTVSGLDPARFNTLAGLSTAIATSRVAGISNMQRQRSRSSLNGMDVDGQPKRPNSSGWTTTVANDLGGDIAMASDGRMGCLVHDDHPPFFTPTYLRRSRHVRRLRSAWNEHVGALRQEYAEYRSQHHHRTSSLSTSPSSVSLGKLNAAQQASTRGGVTTAVQDVIERLPPPNIRDEDKALNALPSKWNREDRQPDLEILADGSEVRFNGITKTSDEAASVRSDHPMPRECGLYYFEVTVLSRGKDSLIGVGFSSKKVNLNRLPGWETDSWAYHGDDGLSFTCTASGKPYGPKFSTQDVIGCGVNFRTGNAFFTKNGVYLGTAFSGIKGERLYPSVGMKKPGEHICVNFGQHPFVFDVNNTMQEERAHVMRQISTVDLSPLHPPDDEQALIHNLIGQYLAHEGYVETAKAFSRDIQEQRVSYPTESANSHCPDSAEDDVHAFNRQKIRRAILDGDIDKALKYTHTFYPHVLEEERNRDITFRLRCRKFIEMMRHYTELSANASSSSPTATMTKSIDSLASNGHTHHTGRVIDDGVNGDESEDDVEEPTDTQMELDDQLLREARRGLHAAAPSPPGDIDMDASQNLNSASHPPKASLMKQNDLLAEALAYGQELQTHFGGDTRPEVKKLLSDIFAIMAYTNPSESVVGGLMDPQGRVSIAEEVNGAILVSLGKPPSAALERLCAQTEALLDEAAIRNGAAAAFVSVQSDFLQA